MINAKIETGNKILKISKYYALIRTIINVLAALILIVFYFVNITKPISQFIHFLIIAGTIFIEIIFIWIFKIMLDGYGLMVCNAAHNLTKNKTITYLDYSLAKKHRKEITDIEFKELEKNVLHDNGYID